MTGQIGRRTGSTGCLFQQKDDFSGCFGDRQQNRGPRRGAAWGGTAIPWAPAGPWFCWEPWRGRWPELALTLSTFTDRVDTGVHWADLSGRETFSQSSS